MESMLHLDYRFCNKERVFFPHLDLSRIHLCRRTKVLDLEENDNGDDDWLDWMDILFSFFPL